MASAVQARLPERPDAGHESYFVHGTPEVYALLRALANQQSLVTAYAGGPADFFATTIIAVVPDQGEFLMEAGPGTAAPSEPGELTLVAFLDNVKVQFETATVGTVGHAGHRALRARMPSKVLRLQRRENFRVAAPVLRAPVCHVPKAGLRAAAAIRVADVSCGGVALALRPDEPALHPGDRLADCVLELPGVPPIGVDLEARHVEPADGKSTPGLRTCGCRFVNLPGPAATLIQRYVNSVERERLRLRG